MAIGRLGNGPRQLRLSSQSHSQTCPTDKSLEALLKPPQPLDTRLRIQHHQHWPFDSWAAVAPGLSVITSASTEIPSQSPSCITGPVILLGLPKHSHRLSTLNNTSLLCTFRGRVPGSGCQQGWFFLRALMKNLVQ